MSVRHIDDLPPDVRAALRRVPRWVPDRSVRVYCACGHSNKEHAGPNDPIDQGTCRGRAIDPSIPDDAYHGPCACREFRPVYRAPEPGWSPDKDRVWSARAIAQADRTRKHEEAA